LLLKDRTHLMSGAIEGVASLMGRGAFNNRRICAPFVERLRTVFGVN
jgi:hypothetical protein